MPSDLRLVFMGTPEFAVASLSAILEAGYNVVGVITAPDKPAGRGMQLTESAVKKFAVAKRLRVLQPEKLKDPAFLEQLRSLNADLQLVVAFRMLPELVWNMPRLGTVNLHGSLLPQYRGAAPINWAVINGERETGVTTFQLQQDIDTGRILLQDRFPIADTDTAGDVHDRMKVIGARLLVKTIDGLAAGTLASTSQPISPDLKHAPKIFTETCRIDWSKSTVHIYNFIRGLSPFPAAFTALDGKTLKIFRSEKEISAPTMAAAPAVAPESKMAPGFETAPGSEMTPDCETAPGSEAALDSETALGSEMTPGFETAPGSEAALDSETAPGSETAPDSGVAPGVETATSSAMSPGLETASGFSTALGSKTATVAGATPNSGVAPTPGAYDTDGKTWLRFATPDGFIRVTELQLEGKKKMSVGDFLRGYRF